MLSQAGTVIECTIGLIKRRGTVVTCPFVLGVTTALATSTGDSPGNPSTNQSLWQSPEQATSVSISISLLAGIT